MALIAKQTLRAGHRLYANPGTVVSQSVVDRHGWHDKVTDDGKTASPDPADPPPLHMPPPAKRGRKKQQ